MTRVPEDDLRELGGSNLTDPDFPRRSAPPCPDVHFVRSRYRLFRRDRGTDLWACACGRESCRRRAGTWEVLSGAYQLWAVPSELGFLDRVVRVLRATGAHFGTAPGAEVSGTGPKRPAVVSNYSDLSRAQRAALLAGQPHERRCVSRPTAEALLWRGLLVAAPDDAGLVPAGSWYRLAEAGLRARQALERGEVPDPPDNSGPRAPRTWRLDDPDPGEDGLEVVDCWGDVWRRRGGRWELTEWASGHPVYSRDSGTNWSEVREYAPLTERLHRDPKRACPADCLQVPMAELLETVQRFLGGTGSLSDLRRARLAGSRALGDSRRASR